MEQDNKTNEPQDSPLTLLLKSPQKLGAPVRSQTPSGLPQSGITAVPPNSLSVDSKPTITLQNVVATVNLVSELDLRKINFCTRNAEYNPARFKGLVMRIREPKTTALIFRSGKVVVTGARSEAAALLAARKYARIIQKLGFPVKFCDFKVQNIVGTCDVRFPIKLESLNQSHGQFSRYEPELFPALVYRLVNPRVVLLIFVNGKVVLTGARTNQEIHKALDSMLPTLRSFRKQQEDYGACQTLSVNEALQRGFERRGLEQSETCDGIAERLFGPFFLTYAHRNEALTSGEERDKR